MFLISTLFFLIHGSDSPNAVCCKEKPLHTKLSLDNMDHSVLQKISDILSKRFNENIEIKSVVQLSEHDRRNLILRINLRATNAPATAIFKQTLDGGESEVDKDILERFSSDWAGLEFISTIDKTIAPVFYGGSIEHKFILFEDLGERHVSLVDTLTGSNPENAKNALTRFMQCLGQLHAKSYGNTDKYFSILKKLNYSRNQTVVDQEMEQALQPIKSILTELNIANSDGYFKHILETVKSNLRLGPFTTLVHGDICPDNVFDSPDKLRIIDFELSDVKSALLDGTYLRMNMPTCWCAKNIPEELLNHLESIYREELKKHIPAAKDNDLYGNAYTQACAYWMIVTLLSIDSVLNKDEIWDSGPTPKDSLWNPKTNGMRSRIISRLQTFIHVAKTNKQLPKLALMTEEVLKELQIRWPDAKPMGMYPAFETSDISVLPLN